VLSGLEEDPLCDRALTASSDALFRNPVAAMTTKTTAVRPEEEVSYQKAMLVSISPFPPASNITHTLDAFASAMDGVVHPVYTQSGTKACQDFL